MRESDYPKVHRRWVAVMVILLLLLFGAFAPVAMGQTWPNCDWGCTAKDTEVTDVWLGDASGNKLGSCMPGSIVDAYIWVTVDNGAADRYQPYLIFDLYINYEDKGQFYECVEDTIPKHSAANYNLYPLTWTCGDRVELKNMVLTWATKSATCSDTADCQNHNKAQCNSTAGMIVKAPLVANFTFDNVCFCTDTTFTDKTTGGDGSYTYDWDFDDGISSAAQNPTHHYGSAKTYTVKLTVTDSSSASDSQSYDVEVYQNPTANAGDDKSISVGDSVVIGGNPTASGGALPYTYSWSPTTGLDDHTIANPTASPTSTTIYTVTVTDANLCTGTDDVVVTVTYSISGIKFNDLNGNGSWDPGEPGLGDWTINLAGPVSGTTTTAAVDGSYTFTNLEPGDYTVSEVLKPGWAQTCPATGTYSVTLTDFPVIDRDFGNRGALSISGVKFNDLNGDGVKDPGEPGLGDWTINLAGPVSGTTTTAAVDGSYTFTNLEPGDYTVSEVLKPGWAQTCPATGTYSVTLTDFPVIDRDFGNRGALSISGVKFNDLNGDGVKDPGEPGLGDWTINLAGPVSGTTTTAAVDGSYTFTNLEPGDYTVSEVLKPGWAQTCPATGTYSVTLTDFPVIDRDFGNRGALSISGVKFNDLNGDGVKDPGEPGLGDWTINLAGPVSGTTTTAAVDGSYTFTNLEPGDYTVSEVLKPGWAQTCPATGTYSVTLTDFPVIDRDFGNRGALSISGVKFNDLNGDGVKDPGEPGLGDWTINLAGPVSGTTTTAAVDGSYTFTNLEPGDYTVSEVLKPGWAQTCPATGTYSVTLTDFPVIDRDFGNRGALSISGVKFNDLNGDGVKDPGEPGLGDWTINLAGPVSGTTTTAAVDGSYTFTNLEPGDYTVSEVLKPGWAQTCPATGTYSVTLTDFPVIDRDFGNRGALSISGVKFNDLNGDGVKDPGEPGLGDWTINLAGPVSGTTTTAAVDGSYTFTNLEPGDYTVSEVLKPGWAQTCPATGTYSVTLTDFPVIDRDFGNRGALSISGVKFNDLNGDGVKDPGEPGLGDWTINLAGPVSGTTTTAAVDGSYTFTNLEPGDYTVSEVLKPGWAQTCPATGTYSVTLTDFPVIDRDFGNRGALSISGVKFNDLNGDGVKDPGEPGLGDWTINLAGPVSGTTTTAAVDGSYTFTNLEPGDYTVSEVLKPGWAQTCPATGTYSVTLTDFPVIDRDFGNRGALSISGVKFNDLNGDGVKDPGEPGLGDWTINLAGPVSGTTTTAAVDGSYTFTNLEPGDYTVSEVLKPGWAQTCPATGTYSVTLTDFPVIDRDFGNRGALSISGVKFNDLNGDGVKDPGEPGLGDWTINLAGPVSGTTTTAAVDGSYTFTNLEPGDYTVSEVLKPGWAQTCPATGTYSVTLTDFPVIDRDFGNRGALSISGVKFNDLNGDGVKDPGEPGLGDWTINLAGPVSGTTTTAAVDGSYTFTNLEPGDYTVSEVLKPGWAQTCPATGTYSVTLTDFPVIDRDFGNRGALSISGVKFNDLNGDGVKDPGEPGLGDWTINLAGPVSGTTTTAAVDGSYTFTNLEPGDYTVSEVLKPGWAQTCPATGTYSVTLTDFPVIDRDFGNRGALSISGVKFNDLNGDGVKDPGEPGLGDWTINLAGPVSGTTTTAAVDGSYTFTNLEPGDYTVSEVLKPGWAQTCPATGTYSVTLTDFPVIDRDFGNRGALSISGVKFNDLNGDGVKDPGEPGLGDWTINLAGPVSGTTTTAAVDGSYTFTNLEPGDYTVSEVLKPGWAQTCPATGTYSVTLTDFPVIDRDFGNRGALSISGVKFNDLNGDGVKDPGEPGLGDWTINLAGPVSGTTTTAAVDGSYTFTNLEPGDYTVSEVLKPGWAQTCPATGTYSVTLTDFPVIDRDFGNRGALSISGVKFNDLNGDGVKDPGEPGLGDWTINLAGPVSGTTTTAAVDGSYTFTNLEPGDYTVSEVLKPGWAQTCPATGTYSVTLTDFPVIDRDFGNRGALSISGVKFNDLNGDGVKDPGEPGLGDWTINLAGPVSGTTTTAAVDGSYTFTNLEPGDYTVSEVLKPGWAQTCPATGTYSVTLTDFPVIDRDFGNRGALSISGVKFNDLNGDGVKDPGEPGLGDWTINLAGPVSGTTTTAAVDGSYTFTNLEPGDYTVSEVLKPGWAQTCPATGTYSVTLTDFPVIDRDFGNRGALSISGVKFNDLNGDGVKDPGEPGLGDWTINLAGPVSGTTTTAAVDGSYTFTNLEPGDYTVSEVLKPGWAQTCPATGTYSVTLTDFPVIDRDFGNRGALSISGVKFNDLNGDGVKDPGEPGLGDWTINLAGPVSGTTTTAAVDGSYTFTNLEPGDYTVSEVLKPGWAQTCPATGTYSVTLTDFPVIDRDFGNRGALSISGVKFNDLNGDGVKDPGEPGLGDWTINLAGPVSGTTTTAAVDGSYTFTNLEPGDYTVSEVLKPGWAQTCPATGTYSVTLTDFPVIDRDFGNRGALSISGVKFNDLNGDGVKDPGEPGLGDWTINLAGPVSGTTTTAAVDGSYTFTNLEPGDYTVSEVLKPGWAQTCPATGTYSVTLTDFPVIDRDFGNWGNPAIKVEKTADPTSGAPSTDVTFTIRVENTGDCELNPVTVVDTLPGGMSYVSDDSGGSVSGQEITWNLGSMGSGASTTISLVAHIDTGATGTLTDTVTATGTPPHGDDVSGTDTADVTALTPGISVTKTADPTEGPVGTDITFTIIVTNTGDCTLNPVRVTDELQQGLSYVSSDPIADIHNGIIIWENVGPLTASGTAGDSTTITLVANIDEGARGVLNNTVHVEGKPHCGDKVTGDDIAQVFVLSVVSVELEKTSSPAIVAPGGNVTYTINYTNTGDVPLHNVVITEHYPDGVTFISASPAPDAGTNNVWTIGTLLPGESGTIVIKVKVPEPIDLSFTETGSVIGEGVVMVTKDLSTEQKPYSLRNSVTLSCAELAPESAYATTKVSGVPGTSLGITESGSGLYSSDEILDLQTKNKSIILEKSTHAEYKPTSFNFSDSFSVNFTNKWKQDICSRNMEIDAAIHKKISDATYIDDETISRVDKDKSVMLFDSSFNGSMYIGARTKDTAISETYIGEFDVLQTIHIGKGPIPTPMPTPTPTPTWLPCPFNTSPEMNMTEDAEPTP